MANIEVPALESALIQLLNRSERLWFGLGRLESAFYAPQLDPIPIERPLYICGLARSGTTLLLELLAEQAAFASTTYRDFPLIMAPIWWNRFQALAGARQAQRPQERAHRDRILVTADSPEAVEEGLWMHFFPHLHDPGRSNVLGAAERQGAFDQFYRHHIRKILHLRGGERYLSKGNYNLTRIGYLHSLFADARFIVPVRAASGQIASLMKQHRLFCAAERADPKVLAYMTRLGHFEFGLNRRPIALGDGVAAEIAAAWERGDEVTGWAHYWASLHGFILDLLAQGGALAQSIQLVSYEALCREPARVLGALYDHAGITPSAEQLAQQAARISYPDYYQSGLDEAQQRQIEQITGPVMERLAPYFA